MRPKGYTLIELVVVLILISVVFAIVLPRFGPMVSNSRLKATARRLTGEIRYLYAKAVRDRKVYRLHLNIETGEVWAVAEEETADVELEEDLLAKLRLPAGIRLEDVVLPGRGKVKGLAVISFSPLGWMDGVTIHLSGEGEDALTLVCDSATGETEIHPGYVEVAR